MMYKIQFSPTIVVLVILFVGLLPAHPSEAATAELGKINLQLSVEVVAFTCGISIDQDNKTIELGSWSNQVFKQKGDTSAAKMILYNITNCPSTPAVTFSFSGPKDAIEPQFLAIEKGILAAKNIAIELLDAEKKHLALDQPSPKILLDKAGNGQAVFYARYVATAFPPQAGTANATATFSIQYD